MTSAIRWKTVTKQWKVFYGFNEPTPEFFFNAFQIKETRIIEAALYVLFLYVEHSSHNHFNTFIITGGRKA